MYVEQQLVEDITEQKQLTIPVSEHLFDEDVHLTGLVEYGISWAKLTSGQAVLPPTGARFDISFEGTFEGPRMKGKIVGVDYLTVRADGRFKLDLHAHLNTDDGEIIDLYENGILIAPDPDDENRTAQMRLNFEFVTTAPKYAWLNQVQGWGRGWVDWQTGQVVMHVYAA